MNTVSKVPHTVKNSRCIDRVRESGESTDLTGDLLYNPGKEVLLGLPMLDPRRKITHLSVVPIVR